MTSWWARWRLKSPAPRLFTQLFIQAQIKAQKTSKLRAIGLCEGNSPVAGEFPAQRTRSAGDVSIWWRHHEFDSIWLSSRMSRYYNMLDIFPDEQNDFRQNCSCKDHIHHQNALCHLWLPRLRPLLSVSPCASGNQVNLFKEHVMYCKF